MLRFCLSHFLFAETPYQTATSLKRKGFGSRFVDILVHIHLAPRQGSMAKEHGGGERARGTVVGNREQSKDEEGRYTRAGPHPVTHPTPHLATKYHTPIILLPPKSPTMSS